MKLMLLAGLLGMGGVMADSVRVYVGTGGEDGIFLTELDTKTGMMSKPILATEAKGAGFLVLDAEGKRMFATARGEDGNSVAGYAVREDGTLELKNYQSSKGKGPCFVGLDGTGRMLMVANYGSGGVAAYAVREDGSVQESRSFFQHEGSSVNEQRQTGPHAHSIYAGPDNKYAYAPDLGTDEVMIYKMDVEGATLTPAGSGKMPPGSGPRHLKFGKDGKQVYVLSEMALTVVVFEREPVEGALAMTGEISVLPAGGEKEGMTCSEVLVSKDGKFVYTANRDVAGKGRDSISVLAVGEKGMLRHVQTVLAEVEIPRNINLSPDGKWLLVAGQKSGGVPSFKVGKDGRLAFSGERIEVPKAMCVVFGR